MGIFSSGGLLVPPIDKTGLGRTYLLLHPTSSLWLGVGPKFLGGARSIWDFDSIIGFGVRGPILKSFR